MAYDKTTKTWEINDLAELKAFRDAVNSNTLDDASANNFSGWTITLANDIDLNNEEWTPIGKGNSFNGTFDGNGKTISNLTITGNKSDVGFFGVTQNGEIKNLTIENAKVSGYLDVGVVAGSPYTSKYTNIKVTGHVEVNGFAYVGGVGGKNAYANWTGITVDVDDTSYVRADSIDGDTAYRTYVGGVIGFMGEGGHTVKDVYSNINVSGSTCDIGGIVGIAHYQNNFENIVVENVKISCDDPAAEEVGLISGTWHNQKGTAVEMTNCKAENVTVTAGADNTDITGEIALGGDAYSASSAQTGALCIATETKDADGNIKIEYTVACNDEEAAGKALNSFVNQVQNQTTGVTGSVEYDEATGVYSYTSTEAIVAKVNGEYFTDYTAAKEYAEKNGVAENDIEKTFNAPAGILYVNSKVTDQAAADAFYGAGVMTYGVNVFGTAAEALDKVADGAEIVVVNSTASEVTTEIDFDKDIEFSITGTAPDHALPVVTFTNATVNIDNADILIPELDARQNAVINVNDSYVADAGGNSIVKSYYNGAINIKGDSDVYTMQMTTMGYITIGDDVKGEAAPEVTATWQTNIYGNGLVTVQNGATFKTAALQLTGKDYSGRDNTDAERVGQPAGLVIDNATMYVGKNVISNNGADYNYNSSHGFNIGTVAGKKAVLDIKNGSTVVFAGANGQSVNVGADGEINIDGSSFTVECRDAGGTGAVNNDGAITVSGKSSVNIGTHSGKEVKFLDGAEIYDSVIGGGVFVAGKVTFSGDNSFGMIYDYGTLRDYYGTTANMEWTVEAGASVAITDKARYGLGYGDKVTVNGTLADAKAARASLTAEDASLFTHGLVAQESSGWNQTSYFTVNDAYVIIGDNNSFGNKPGAYGGNYVFRFNNAVVDSSRITFYEANSTTNFVFKDSDVKLGTFMTNDADSVFTLDNTVLLSTATTNGTDENNTNAGKLTLINGSKLTYSVTVTNKNEIAVNNSTFIAPELDNTNGTFTVSGASTLNIAKYNGELITLAGGTVLTDTSVTVDAAIDSKIVANGDLTVNANAFTNFDIITVAGDLAITGADLTAGGYVLTGDVRVSGAITSVNGFDVVNGKFNDGEKVYSIVKDTAGLKISEVAEIAELSGTVSGYAQSVGEDYLFTLNCTADGGEGDKVYSVKVYNNGELVDVVTSSNANGVKFALASIPTYDNITVDVFVSDKYNTVQIADDYKVEVVDYTAPKFNVKVAGAEVSAVDADEKANDVTISWGASDNFAVTGYIVDVNGEKSYFDGSVTSMDLKDLANGDYAVKVTAIDAAGNQKVSQTDFSVKVVRPVAEQAAVVNDFDGDAKSDAIVATDPVFKVLGSAAADAVTGEFKNAAVGIVEDGWEVLGTGYFNEDNVADVLIQNETTGEIEALFMSYADGKYTASQEALEMDMTGWTFAGIGDVNGDGIDDIIASKAHADAFDENNNKIADAFVEYAAFESQYDGSFKQTSSLGGIGTDAADWKVIGLSDMDGDNKDDVVWMNSASQEIGYWASSAQEGANPWVSLAAGAADWTFAGIGDFDKDTKSELLWTHEDGLIGYWQESAAGTDKFFTSLGSTSEMEGFTIDAIGDYNGDGIDDILWSADNGEKKAWLINSDNTHTVSIIAC